MSHQHIFLSYSHKDLDFARYLRAILEKEGFQVWTDEKRISAGMDWTDEIQKAVDDCCALVIIMTPESRESKFVQSEILHAMDRKKPIFPVLLVGEPFFLLKSYQNEDMRAGLSAQPSFEFLQNLRTAVGVPINKRKVRFEIVHGDALTFSCDVLILKYAQDFFGVDLQVSHRFEKLAESLDDPTLLIDETFLKGKGPIFRKTDGCIEAQNVLFVPTVRLNEFDYTTIRDFTKTAFSLLLEHHHGVTKKHIGMTIHGAMFGLDAAGSLLAQLGEIVNILQSSSNVDIEQGKVLIERVSIIERSGILAQHLRDSAAQYFEREQIEWDDSYLLLEKQPIPCSQDIAMQDIKPYALCIMQDDDDLDDIFYYGIQQPIHATGLLCERIHLSSEKEDEKLQRQLKRIQSARIVICDTSHMSPMLHLFLGCAWGADVPTVLITQSDDDFQFDERHYIHFKKIRELQERLGQWVKQKLD